MALIFGVETSCDDTSVGIARDGIILANATHTQIAHERFGGIVPELAARDHIKNIIPVAEEALEKSGARLSDMDAFAVTIKPGLIGSLLVGSQFAKSLALSFERPFYAIDHLRAHIVSPCIESGGLRPPFLCLLASGGHTQIVLCESWLDMRLIGKTLDDAAGEAFDKSARLLGFLYAGGARIDKMSTQGDPARFKLPLPKAGAYNYSFSGLKTAVRYLIQHGAQADEFFIEKNKADLCASIQYAITEALIKPFFRAARDLNIKRLCIAGGVSANSYFRKRMQEICDKEGCDFHAAHIKYSTDNGAMIAFLAEKYYELGIPSHALSLPCIARHEGY